MRDTLPLTGYPLLDKLCLKHYSKDAINACGAQHVQTHEGNHYRMACRQ